jgi:TRAP-type C4-dicarboxylate transport system permease large subunit
VTEYVEPRIKFRVSGEALAGTIYGFVTAMAVMAALADKDANVFFMAGVAIGTSVALALTFVYSHWLAGSYSDQPHAGGRVAWRFELPTIFGPIFLSVVMILIKVIGNTYPYEAAEAAMWVGVAILFLLGFRIAQHGGRSRWASVRFGLIDAMIGAWLVLAKVLVH